MKKPAKKSVAINSTAESEELGCPDPASVVDVRMSYLSPLQIAVKVAVSTIYSLYQSSSPRDKNHALKEL